MGLPPNSYPEQRKGFPWFKGLLFLFLGAVAGAAFLAIFAHQAEQGIWDHLASLATGRSKTEFHSQPSVVEKIRELKRLETVVYTIDKVVEGDRESLILPDFLAGDKILLIAHGEVIAGIDLSTLQPSNVCHFGPKYTRSTTPSADFFSPSG